MIHTKEALTVVQNLKSKVRVSLNSQLLQGPNLTSSLVGVLARFRQKRVAIMADVQSMFQKVKVGKERLRSNVSVEARRGVANSQLGF